MSEILEKQTSEYCQEGCEFEIPSDESSYIFHNKEIEKMYEKVSNCLKILNEGTSFLGRGHIRYCSSVNQLLSDIQRKDCEEHNQMIKKNQLMEWFTETKNLSPFVLSMMGFDGLSWESWWVEKSEHNPFILTVNDRLYLYENKILDNSYELLNLIFNRNNANIYLYRNFIQKDDAFYFKLARRYPEKSQIFKDLGFDFFFAEKENLTNLL